MMPLLDTRSFVIRNASLVAKAAVIVLALHGGVGASIVLPHILGRVAPDKEFGSDTDAEFSETVMTVESDASSGAPDVSAEERPQIEKIEEVLSKTSSEDIPTEQLSPEKSEDLDLRLAIEQTQKTSENASEQFSPTEAIDALEQQVSNKAVVSALASVAQTGDSVADAGRLVEEGNSPSAKRAIDEWQKKIFGHIARFKTYPHEARKRHLTGETVVAFRIDPNGRVLDIKIGKSSGQQALDDAALEVLRRANPVPRPPQALASRLEFSIPIRFSLK